MVTGLVHWIVNVSNCIEIWIARRKHQPLQTAGKDNGIPQKDRERPMDRQREKEGGRMLWFMKNDDKSMIDVENVETTGERCCHHADEHH